MANNPNNRVITVTRDDGVPVDTILTNTTGGAIDRVGGFDFERTPITTDLEGFGHDTVTYSMGTSQNSLSFSGVAGASFYNYLNTWYDEVNAGGCTPPDYSIVVDDGGACSGNPRATFTNVRSMTLSFGMAVGDFTTFSADLSFESLTIGTVP